MSLGKRDPADAWPTLPPTADRDSGSPLLSRHLVRIRRWPDTGKTGVKLDDRAMRRALPHFGGDDSARDLRPPVGLRSGHVRPHNLIRPSTTRIYPTIIYKSASLKITFRYKILTLQQIRK